MHNGPILGVMLSIKQISQRLQAHAPTTERGEHRERGDHDLNPGLRPDGALRAAAVLIALVDHGAEINVLLTRRAEHLEHHPGEISFPGGHIEQNDPHAVAAALRETHEEIGLAPESVEVLGRLDDYVTRTGFHITPVVGMVRPPLHIKPDPYEVDEVFEVPLAFFLDPANHHRHQRIYEGAQRSFYAMPYGDYYIWGATAGMLVNLYQTLTPETDGTPQDAPIDASSAN